MADERNFRSNYYDKVGFRAVEEKKSIEILLKEQTIDITKLLQFVLRFPLISAYRLTVWKYLLGVVPIYQEIYDFVMEQRSEQFQDLKHALEIMDKMDEKTPQSAVFLQMYLINGGCLPYDQVSMMQEPRNQAFMAITDSMSEICSSEVESFWLSVKFYQYLKKFRPYMPIMTQRTEHFLKKEDKGGALVSHLTKLHVFEVIPLQHWFECCFARVLPEDTFERIWDRVLGGSCKIMVFVAVAILLTHKWIILKMNSAEKVIQMLESDISTESGEMIVNHALELWNQYGHPLLPSASHSDSPVPDAKPNT